MKTYNIPEINLGKHDIEELFKYIFDESTLYEVHGTSLILTAWDDNKRKLNFYVAPELIPRILRRTFCNSGFHVMVDQTLHKEEDCWKIQNDIKLHYPNIKIQSEFEIRKGHFTGHIKVEVKFFRFLNGIIESFFIQQCKNETNKYMEVVARKLLADG